MKISIQITPNSSKNEIIGWYANFLKIKIAAPPEKGKANRELVKFLSKEWDVRKSSIHIVKGETSRNKILEVVDVTNLPLPENPQKSFL